MGPNVLDLYMTVVEKDGQFLKIYGQKEHDTALNVERMILQFIEQFEQGIGIPDPKSLRLNSMCCARYDDGSYYRARIIGLEEDRVRVEFVDYGNVGIVQTTSIRVPDNAQNLFNIPPQASSYILCGVTGMWDEKTLLYITQLICYENLRCSIVGAASPHNNIQVLRIFHNYCDFSERLAREGVAAILPQDQFMLLVNAYYSQSHQMQSLPTVNGNYPPFQASQMMNLLNPALANLPMWQRVMAPNTVAFQPTMQAMPSLTIPNYGPATQPAYTQPANMSGFRKSPTPLSLAPATQFTSQVLEPDSSHSVFVSSVENGPLSFVVQLTENERALGEMMAELNDAARTPLQPLKMPLVPGSMCLGRFSEDNSLCRAVVIAVPDDKCKVYYVDYGNSEMLSSEDIYELPAKFTHPKVMALQFSLAGLKDIPITDTVKQVFTKLVRNQPAVVEVVRPKQNESCIKQLCELYLNEKNVKQLLNEELLKLHAKVAFQNVQLPLPGSEVKVLVAYVKSVTNFYVQLASQQNDLTSLMAGVAEYCNGSADKLEQSGIRAGSPCCALFPADGQWYRALVLDPKPDAITVLYVDYGNEEKVSLSDLRKIDLKLVTKLRAQAIPCKLSGFENEAGNDDLDARFEELTLEKTLTMHVIALKRDDPCLVIRLTDESGVDIGSVLQTKPSEVIRELRSGRESSVNSAPSQVPKLLNGNERVSKPHVENRDGETWGDSPKEASAPKSGSGTRNGSDFGSRHAEKDSGFGTRDKGGFGGGRSDRNGTGFGSRNEDKQAFGNQSRDGEGGFGGRSRDGEGGFGGRSRDGEGGFGGRNRDGTGGFGGRNRDGTGGFGGRNRDAGFGGRNRDGDGDGGGGGFGDAGKGSRGKQSGGWNQHCDRVNSGHQEPENSWDEPTPAPSSSTAPATLQSVTLPVGCKKSVVIVYATNPADFYVQESPSDPGLDTLMARIAENYTEGGEQLPSMDIKVGTLCIARFYDDDTWYRAVIKKVDGPSITVLFPDYGNHQDVKIEDLKKIEPDMRTLKAQAIHCCLIGVQTPGSGWSDDQIAEFSCLLESQTLEAEFLMELDGIYSIALKDTTQKSSVNEAFGATLDSMLTPTSLVTSVPSQVLSPGSTCEAIVSWFINPSRFFIQLKNSQDQFKSMMIKLQKDYKNKEPLSSVPLEQVVIARFKDDNTLYRAQVIKQRGSKSAVEYIDYGNRSIVEQSSIYGLEHQFSTLPRQAVLCSLKGVLPLDDEWPKDCSSISKLLEGDLTCTIHEQLHTEGEGDVASYIVSLKRSGVDLSEQLVESGLARSLEPCLAEGGIIESAAASVESSVDLPLLIGQLVPAYIASMELPSLFVHLEHYIASQIEEQLNQLGTDPKNLIPLPADKVVVGERCLICFESLYRRAVLADCSGTSGFIVHLIDEGGAEEVPPNGLFILPEEVALIPEQAKECSLTGAELSKNLEKELQATVLHKEVILRVDGLDDERLSVTIMNTCGQCFPFEDSDASVQRICPMPVLRRRTQVLVVHADGTVVWLQLVKQAGLVARLLDDLYSEYEEAGEILDSTEEGLFCVAKSMDGNWYRAQISGSTNDGVLVSFVDYGNTEVLPPGNLKKLSPDFSTHALAIKASLPVVSDETSLGDSILEMTSGKEYTAVFAKGDDGWLVELLHGKSEFSKELVLCGKAVNIANNPFADLLAVPEQDISFGVGDSAQVYVCHVESASEIYVQLCATSQLVDKLQEDLQTLSHCMMPVDSYPPVGTKCMALFAGDGQWYRGRVVDAGRVHFVDYGNTECVDLSNIRALPPSMAPLNDYGIKCSLKQDRLWTPEATLQLQELIGSEEVIQANVISEVGDLKIIDLCIAGKSITESLVKEGLFQKSESSASEKRNVFVSFHTSPANFWISDNDSAQLDDITSRLKEGQELKNVPVGTVCAALFEDDGLWYRGRVEFVNDGSYDVLFIDYGNKAVSTQLKSLSPDIAAIPPLAKHCCLYLPSTVVDWSEEANKRFSEMVAEGAAVFEAVVLIEGNPAVVDLTLDGKKVDQELLNLCQQTKSKAVVEKLTHGEVKMDAYVVHVNSPSDFFIQAVSDTDQLQMMVEKLQEAETFEEMSNYEPGALCAALFVDDGQWYRAKVLSKSSTGVEVLFIDYGNIAVSTELRTLPADLTSVPRLAKYCTLPYVKGLAVWTDTAREKFKELSAYGDTLFEVELVTQEEPIVVQLHVNGKSVLRLLAELCEIGSGAIEELIASPHKLALRENARIQSGLTEESTPQAGVGSSEESDVSPCEISGEDIISKAHETIQVEGEAAAVLERKKSGESSLADSSSEELEKVEDAGNVIPERDEKEEMMVPLVSQSALEHDAVLSGENQENDMSNRQSEDKDGNPQIDSGVGKGCEEAVVGHLFDQSGVGDDLLTTVEEREKVDLDGKGEIGIGEEVCHKNSVTIQETHQLSSTIANNEMKEDISSAEPVIDTVLVEDQIQGDECVQAEEPPSVSIMDVYHEMPKPKDINGGEETRKQGDECTEGEPKELMIITTVDVIVGESDALVQETPSGDNALVQEMPSEDDVLVQETVSEDDALEQETPDTFPEDDVLVQETLLEDYALEQEIPSEDVLVQELPYEGGALEQGMPSEVDVLVQEVPSEDVLVQEMPSEDVLVQEMPSEVDVLVQEMPSEVDVLVQEMPSEDDVLVQEMPSEVDVLVQEMPSEVDVLVQEVPSEDVLVQEMPSEDDVLVQEMPSEDDVLVQEMPSEDDVLVQEMPSEDDVLVQETLSEDDALEQETPSEEDALVRDTLPEDYALLHETHSADDALLQAVHSDRDTHLQEAPSENDALLRKIPPEDGLQEMPSDHDALLLEMRSDSDARWQESHSENNAVLREMSSEENNLELQNHTEIRKEEGVLTLHECHITLNGADVDERYPNTQEYCDVAFDLSIIKALDDETSLKISSAHEKEESLLEEFVVKELHLIQHEDSLALNEEQAQGDLEECVMSGNDSGHEERAQDDLEESIIAEDDATLKVWAEAKDRPAQEVCAEAEDSPQEACAEAEDSPPQEACAEAEDSPAQEACAEAEDSPPQDACVEAKDSPPQDACIEAEDSPAQEVCAEAEDNSPQEGSIEAENDLTLNEEPAQVDMEEHALSEDDFTHNKEQARDDLELYDQEIHVGAEDSAPKEEQVQDEDSASNDVHKGILEEHTALNDSTQSEEHVQCGCDASNLSSLSVNLSASTIELESDESQFREPCDDGMEDIMMPHDIAKDSFDSPRNELIFERIEDEFDCSKENIYDCDSLNVMMYSFSECEHTLDLELSSESSDESSNTGTPEPSNISMVNVEGVSTSAVSTEDSGDGK